MNSAIRHVAVVDIGKTNAKVALVDLDARRELVSRTQPNRVRRDGPYPHHDVDAIWTFVLEGLAALRRGSPIDAVSVTTHGATAALVDVQASTSARSCSGSNGGSPTPSPRPVQS